MTSKQVYRLASERIANGKNKYCCDSINYIENFKNTINLKKFEEIFKPLDNRAFWWGLNYEIPTEEYFKENEQNQLARSLALLFMAEMESE